MYTISRAFLTRKGAVAAWWLVASQAIAAVLFFTLSALVACDGGCVSVKEVEKRINRVVSIGDSREEVAEAMDRAKIMFTYDQHDHRFRAGILEGCKRGTSIVIHLSFNDLDKLKKIEVHKNYTAW
jgi:hypothetical protein